MEQEQLEKACDFYEEHLVNVVAEQDSELWYDEDGTHEIPRLDMALVCVNCRESFLVEFGRMKNGEIRFLGGFVDGISECSEPHVDSGSPDVETLLDEVDSLLDDDVRQI